MIFNLFVKKNGNWKDDTLSGLTVALALVPEAIAFSFIAGVDPIVGSDIDVGPVGGLARLRAHRLKDHLVVPGSAVPR